MTMASQTDVVKRHVEDATAAGGRTLAGGAVDGGYLPPTVLLDVPESAVAIREETFGPTLTDTRVRDAEDALERTNTTAYGLGGSVFTKSKERRLDDSPRMRSRMHSIHSVHPFASVPALPFGGVGD